MNKKMKQLLSLAVVAATASTFTLASYAEEVVPEQPATEINEPAPVTDFSASVTLTALEDEYTFVLDEKGAIKLIEGTDKELAASVLEQGKTINESIDLILSSYEEKPEYKISIASTDEELGKTLNEELKGLVEGEIETEIKKQPEFIQKRFEMAKQLGITPGKMNLLEKLAASTDEDVNYEELAKKSVKEIMAEVKANKKPVVETELKVEATKQAEVEKKADDVKKEKPQTEKKSEKSNGKGKGKN